MIRLELGTLRAELTVIRGRANFGAGKKSRWTRTMKVLLENKALGRKMGLSWAEKTKMALSGGATLLGQQL